jgi:hypothetical protein
MGQFVTTYGPTLVILFSFTVNYGDKVEIQTVENFIEKCLNFSCVGIVKSIRINLLVLMEQRQSTGEFDRRERKHIFLN